MKRLIAFSLLLIAMPALAGMALNPAVTQGNIQDTICVKGYTKTVRPEFSYTNRVKKQFMRQAGIPQHDIHDYELDHIVPLGLGGNPYSLDNLQLQPWDGENGAHRKDRIEVKLQCLVCSGQVPLNVAQHEIFTDWQAAYHRYALLKCGRSRSDRHW